jgi:hypothetical protein
MKKLQAMSESIEDTVQVYFASADNDWRLKQERSVYGPTSSPSPAKPTPDRKSSRPALARLDRPYHSGGQLGRRSYNTRIDQREENLIGEVRRTRRTRVYVDPDADYVDEDGTSSLIHRNFESHSENRVHLDPISDDDPFTQTMGAAHFRNGTLNVYHGQQVAEGLHSLAAVAANSTPVVSNADNFFNTNGSCSQQHQQDVQANISGYTLRPTMNTLHTNVGYPIMIENSYGYRGQHGGYGFQPGFSAHFGYAPQGGFKTHHDVNGAASSNVFNNHGPYDIQQGFATQGQFKDQQQHCQHGDNCTMSCTVESNYVRSFSNGLGFGNGAFKPMQALVKRKYSVRQKSADTFSGISSMLLQNNGNQWESGQRTNGFDSRNSEGTSANMFDQPTRASMEASVPLLSSKNRALLDSPRLGSTNVFGQPADSMIGTANAFEHQNNGLSSNSIADNSPPDFPLLKVTAGFGGLPEVEDGFVIPGLNINVPMDSIEDKKDDLIPGLGESSDDNRTITAPVTPL